MALAAIIEQSVFDGLNDEFKKEYKKQDDGTYLLDVTPVKDVALENVKGLKSALSAERAAKEKAESTLKTFEGLDVEKAKSALKKVEEMTNWKPEDKVKEQIEAIKKQLEEKHQGELGKKDESIGTMKKQLEKLIVEANAVKAISESKGNIELLLPHVKNNVRMKQSDNGEFTVEVVDKDGNVRITSAAGQTGNMTIAELVTEMKTNNTYAAAFEGSNASGSGSGGGGNPTGTNTIRASDQAGLEANIDKIASGDMQVVD